ncbi:hypothetical protein HWV62_39936 [Athelia sp. TMB]|nr:hypothetical protein HWV62_39936 [Athelia sp. TMB]
MPSRRNRAWARLTCMVAIAIHQNLSLPAEDAGGLGAASVHIGPIFNTGGISGGSVINVAGDYIAADSDNPGVAGSGKTAIAHTIAQKLRDAGLLGSCFFFSRSTASRNTPQTLFITIAHELASKHPGAAAAIAQALEVEPALATASLSRQFDALILQPSRRLPTHRPIVLVIDALDECINHDLDTELLTILRDRATQLPQQVRILITSRPTSTIEEYLSRCSHVKAHPIDIFSVENCRDISEYVDAQLRNESILKKMRPASPDETMISDLKKLAEGLFIWIATVCNFLATAYKPMAKLRALLSKSAHSLPPERKMDELYAAILAECGDWNDADFLQDYRLVMGSIMAAKRPLSLATLRALHDGAEDSEFDPEELLHRFGSVLVGFRDLDEPIRILHLSFREFITDRAVANDSTKHLYLSEKEHSARLAELCIDMLNRELAKPIPGAGYLQKPSNDGPGIPPMLEVPEHVVYGCAYWPSHMQDVGISQIIWSPIVTLISKHLVTWIEVVTSTDIFRGSLASMQWLLASVLFALSNRLSYVGRLEEALLAVQEGVDLLRALADKQPELYNADLARALNNMSNGLLALGQPEKALKAVQEAVNLWRALAVHQPAAHHIHVGLAMALNNLSNHLSALGQVEEASSATRESVRIYRNLATASDGAWVAGNAGLASALNNLARHFAALKEPCDALSAVHEATNLYRALAAEQPEVYTEDLARVLENLSNCLSELEQPRAALAAAEEALVYWRVFAAERPGAHSGNLAMALSNLSIRLSELGRLQDALPVIREAVDLYEALAEQRSAVHNTNLAMALMNLSGILARLDRRQEALEAIQKAVDLYRDLVKERPMAHDADLAMALQNLATIGEL